MNIKLISIKHKHLKFLGNQNRLKVGRYELNCKSMKLDDGVTSELRRCVTRNINAQLVPFTDFINSTSILNSITNLKELARSDEPMNKIS